MSFTLEDTTIYGEGANFDTEKHAVNLYSPGNPGNSVYGRLNGRLGDDTLHPDFRLNREHVWPNLMARAFGASSLLPVEYFNSSAPAGGNPYSLVSDPEKYGTVAGTSIKFFLPYSSVCLIDISTYLSIWRPFYVDDHDIGDRQSAKRQRVHSFPARLRLVVDSQVEMERGLPFSAQMSPAKRVGSGLIELAGAEETVGDVRMHEVSQGFYKSMHHLTTLVAGWHEAHLEYRLDTNTFGQEATVKRGNKAVDTELEVGSRVLCGTRNARVLSLRQQNLLIYRQYGLAFDPPTVFLKRYYKLQFRVRTYFVYVSNEKGEELVLKAQKETGESDNLTVLVQREPEQT